MADEPGAVQAANEIIDGAHAAASAIVEQASAFARETELSARETAVSAQEQAAAAIVDTASAAVSLANAQAAAAVQTTEDKLQWLTNETATLRQMVATELSSLRESLLNELATVRASLIPPQLAERAQEQAATAPVTEVPVAVAVTPGDPVAPVPAEAPRIKRRRWM